MQVLLVAMPEGIILSVLLLHSPKIAWLGRVIFFCVSCVERFCVCLLRYTFSTTVAVNIQTVLTKHVECSVDS